ncbi:MAG: TIGR03067 domain-containing protein [Planctomycetes bacterium]|nr:TIGR03067 domain-containing protein [Planctomycetota bacterium]
MKLTARYLTSYAVLLAISGFSQAAPNDPPAKDADDIKKLIGVWEGYAVEGKGEKPDRGPVHIRLTITADKMSAIDLNNGDKDMGNGTYKVDASKPKKELDANGVVLPGKRERKFLGIYELNGDTLKWCVDNRSQGRPEELQTVRGNFLLILKRKK